MVENFKVGEIVSIHFIFFSSTGREKTDTIGRETGGILRCLQRCGWGVGGIKVVAEGSCHSWVPRVQGG